jgi:uncharacterized RDD family membrane protein YckC
MSQALWYFVDTNQRQIGPVPVEELRAALQTGATTMDALAWRDGLSGWQPIRELATELGLAATAVSTATPAAPTPPAYAAAQTADQNPYRAPESMSAEGAFVGGGDVVYAGFWRRWAALFLDQLILAIPLSIVYFFLMLGLGITGGLMNTAQPPIGAILGMEFAFYLVWWTACLFYFATLESSEAQGTFGKRALGIKVTDLEGRRISFKHAMGRWFAAALSYMSIYIGFLMAGFTQRKQALHDVLAGTLVVDRWAFTSSPERQERKPSGCVIVFMVVVIGSLLVIPILVAIAVAQFAEYSRRAGHVYVEPPATIVCVVPASSEYVARCLPPSFEA